MFLQYQLHNRVENLADISTRCSGLLQGEIFALKLVTYPILQGEIFALKKTRASGRNVGKVFNPVVKLVLENQPFQIKENLKMSQEGSIPSKQIPSTGIARMLAPIEVWIKLLKVEIVPSAEYWHL